MLFTELVFCSVDCLRWWMSRGRVQDGMINSFLSLQWKINNVTTINKPISDYNVEYHIFITQKSL